MRKYTSTIRLEDRAFRQERKGNYQKAIEYYQKAIEILMEGGVEESYRLARLYEKMAICYNMLNDLKNRARCYDKAAEYYLKIGYTENAKMCKYQRDFPGERLIRTKVY